ncbi:uncharacterized protein EKO05_0009328 [Ascochyta rabiei]|uniref:Cell outer membrane n=1 Tax=Didymella rabiei TaxID=5454 RepID=A0A163EYV1_DIDRA|nr:uncharacterized protein EKO05_0009328 [Ascochyta rabiei]KZM24026.1 cell outer membrane [Ascochyta rabiei]UPX19052.1 hypothetical protein EKO05_0009328 [Ascochyta rabiei]
MADSSLSNLNYGRPGLSTYDLDSREWIFSRQPSSKKLKQVACWQLAVPAATNFPPARISTNATTVRRDARRLTHDHPQLVPAIRQLPELNLVSDAVTSAAGTYDPLIGDLMSFGTVFLKKYGRPNRIAALPAGPSGNILRLVIAGQQKQGWGTDKSVWLSGPTLEDADSGYWNEDAAPIQQVCFAQAQGGNSFLAVRLPSKTVILRPSYHRGRQAAEPSIYYSLPPSLVSARPILNITLGQTGGTPHADVSFNPDYQFQFGVVDHQYKWSIWQIERRAKRDECSVSRLTGGELLPDEDTILNDGDGWARILWAGDSNTLIVCNRRHLSLISISGKAHEYLQVPTLVPQRSTDWILDIKRHPQLQNRFFVLTTTKIHIIAVTTLGATVDNTANQAGATFLFSRRHYRGDEDLTLHLSLETLIEDTTHVLLCSRLNSLAQVYYFQTHHSGPSELLISQDPVPLDLTLSAAAHITHMRFDTLEYGTREQWQYNKINRSAHSYFEQAVPFYQLTVTLSDFSVLQTVLVEEIDSGHEALVWNKVIHADRTLYASTNVEEMDDFVAPDGLLGMATPETKLKSQTLRLLPQTDQSLERAMNYTSIYETLVHGDQNATSTRNATAVDALAKRLQEAMKVDGDTVEPGHGYVVEILDSTIDVVDIDEASTKINGFFATDDLERSYALQYIARAQVLHLPESEEQSVAFLYDTILQHWIAPLAADIPIPVRQAKERLARRVAAEVTLASARLRPKDDALPSPHGADSGDIVSLPILPSKLGAIASIGPAANMFPSSLPTPPQSSVPPSSQPPSSPTPPEFSIPPSTGDPLSRLRKHLTIKNELLTPTVIHPNVSELLSHWNPGSDPGSYDWEATEHSLRPEAPDEVSQELREKERKKRERREKRQRREDELMRAKSQTSSQAVFAQPPFPRSSPGPTFGGMGPSSQVPIPSSSQTPNQFHGQRGAFGGFGGVHSTVPQSQVEPGRFGGRPDKKKKKKGKSRVSGF